MTGPIGEACVVDTSGTRGVIEAGVWDPPGEWKVDCGGSDVPACWLLPIGRLEWRLGECGEFLAFDALRAWSDKGGVCC